MNIKDKVIGSWCGMAIGDAMGLSAKSMKPETVKQLFGAMNSFKDVSPFIDKGVKRFKMKGLYGIQTQSSLVIADILLKNKKLSTKKIAELLIELSVGGPEYYFGVYRHSDKSFSQLIDSLKEKQSQAIEHNQADATFLTMGIPAGLLHRGQPEMGTFLNIGIGLIMSRNLCEVTGLAITGYLVSRLLLLEPGIEESSLHTEQILIDVEEYCHKIEARIQETSPILWHQTPELERGMLQQTIKNLRERWDLNYDELLNWTCQNASNLHKTKITSPAQSYVLTLLPLCLILVLRKNSTFDSSLTSGLNMGKEANKLGALTGVLAGAIYGWEGIPKLWRSGLVNIKEIRMRGDGLFSGRFPKAAKNLYEMELGLTTKEFDVGKKYFLKSPVKHFRLTPRPKLYWKGEDENESIIPDKSDIFNWRKFEKDKSKAKKERRKHLKKNDSDY